MYYQLFRELEENHVLDPLNEFNLYCLHYAHLPRINQSLTVTTEGNMTLHQLFFEEINYIVTNYPSDVQLSSVTVDVASMAGDRVEVSRNLFHPCPALVAHLSAINILRCKKESGFTCM